MILRVIDFIPIMILAHIELSCNESKIGFVFTMDAG